MTTKHKRMLDGTPRRHPSRERQDWKFLRTPRGLIVWPAESVKTTQGIYHEYYSAENVRARVLAARDVKRMKKFGRVPSRRALTQMRNEHYESLKKKD